jgi:hypothetical protein
MQDGKPIAGEGMKMSDSETRYTVREEQLLAVHDTLQKWRCYLEGPVKVNVIADHVPNTWLASQPTLLRRQASWSEFMQRFKLQAQTNVGLPSRQDQCG